MAKTDLTLKMERMIWDATVKMGVFGCFEVTIGWLGNERVDYLTYDTKGTWRCYEIKVSKSDFRSKAAVTFVGHFNYYVMPQELYEQVKDEIPDGIGVYVGGISVKRARRQELGVEPHVLYESMIRSMSRDVETAYHNAGLDPVRAAHEKNRKTIRRMRQETKRLRELNDFYQRKYREHSLEMRVMRSKTVRIGGAS